MYQANLDKRSLRSALLLGAASVAAISLSAPAMAQDQTTETVVVTGSRIPQTGLYSPSPVTAVGQQEMKFEGTTGVETLLNNLPSVLADQTSGESNGASGTATVDLRGLGAVRTLVLVNGTRLMPGDPQDPVADLNQIPAALVDHVDVLTGGASAVYGSDALAGVVNFVMRKDFDGIEFDGQYGIDQADNTNANYRNIVSSAGDPLAKENIWDGANETGTLIMGANTDNGKGNVTAYVGYENTEAVLAAARDYSACSFIGGATSSGAQHECGGSSTKNKFISLDTGTAYYEQGTGKAGSGMFVPFVGGTSQLFNYGAQNYLQRPDTRYSGGFFAHYEVNKELDVYSSFMFMDDNSIAQIGDRGLFSGEGAQGGSGLAPGYYFDINCSNPLMTSSENYDLCGTLPGDAPVTSGGRTYYNGAGNNTAGQASVEIGRRGIESGPLDSDLRHTAYRMQIGAKGDLGDGWSYDVYAQYGESIFSETDTGYWSTSKAQNALQVTTNASGQPVCISGGSCVPLDIFNGIGSVTPSMLGYVETPGLINGYTEEQIVSGNVTGDLGKYGIQSPFAQNPVAVSFGSEYRAEYLELQPDEENLEGDLNGSGGILPATPRSGFNVKEAFTEVKIPLVQEKPWAEDLSFNGGYRYSSYSTAGSTSAYKYGLEWQPVDDLRFRASYERAVRAPNVLELFRPDEISLASAQDPCATSKAGMCATVPNAGNSTLLSCPSAQCNQESGGSTSLRPEIGDTRTIGAVITPTFLDGFTSTIDYFDIDMSGAIGSVPVGDTLEGCYGASATAASEAEFCPLVHRNSIGQIYGNGYVGALNENLGFEHTKGFDFEANYSWDFDSMPLTAGYGSLQMAFLGTWEQSFEVEPVPGGGTYDCAGLFGVTCGFPRPKWRHRLRVTWETPWDMDFSVNWRYMSGVKLDADQTSNPLLAVYGTSVNGGPFDPVDSTINDYWYLDLAADWSVRTGVDLHAGINNVFDRLPPALSSYVYPVGIGNDNTFPGTYDTLGRTMFVGVTIKY